MLSSTNQICAPHPSPRHQAPQPRVARTQPTGSRRWSTTTRNEALIIYPLRSITSSHLLQFNSDSNSLLTSLLPDSDDMKTFTDGDSDTSVDIVILHRATHTHTHTHVTTRRFDRVKFAQQTVLISEFRIAADTAVSEVNNDRLITQQSAAWPVLFGTIGTSRASGVTLELLAKTPLSAISSVLYACTHTLAHCAATPDC